MSSDKVSVIVPIYNSERYLARCLTSIIESDYENLEIICINDGSTDRSADILDQFSKIDSRILILNQSNAGVSVARNAGLEQASGDWVTFVDADDWIHRSFCSVLLREAVNRNADIIAADFIRSANEDSEFDDVSNGYSCVGISLRDWLNETCMKNYCTMKLFRRAILMGIQFEPGITIAEDVLFNAQLMLNKPNLIVFRVNAKLYAYYKNLSSAVHTFRYEDKCRTFECLFELLQEQPVKTAVVKGYYLEIVKQMLGLRYSYSFRKNYKVVSRACNEIMDKSLKQLSGFKPCQAAAIVFRYFPAVYRAWRNYTDPTLKAWEADERRRLESSDE